MRVLMLVASMVILKAEFSIFAGSNWTSASHLSKWPWAEMNRASATKLIWLCAWSTMWGRVWAATVKVVRTNRTGSRNFFIMILVVVEYFGTVQITVHDQAFF